MAKRAATDTTVPADTTIGEYLGYLAPALWSAPALPAWPPDAFALVASLLRESGGYGAALSCLPTPRGDWVKEVEKLGSRWTKKWQSSTTTPARLRGWWRTIRGASERPMSEIRHSPDLCRAVISILAAADYACVGIGIPTEGGEMDEFEAQGFRTLLDSQHDFGSTTLCRNIHPSRARVLPKMHTPQTGLTLRSLSHHVALCPTGDVMPKWSVWPAFKSEDLGHKLNLLVVPWPSRITPTSFGVASRPDAGRASFSFDPPSTGNTVAKHLARLLANARTLTGDIDGVIFPELALDQSEYRAVARVAAKHGVLLVCGVRESRSDRKSGRNYVSVSSPVAGDIGVKYEQDKHHPWRLDKSQIRQYSLGGRLDPTMQWWENIAVNQREVTINVCYPWLTFCVLVCEDLARQEPVSNLVRAIGPNLVIALLMDGPQLHSRWPSRYASVLADDPGSSVLTVTSLGMTELSRAGAGPARPRVIAMWRDARSGPAEEIELPPGMEAAVLSLTEERATEYTADGRHDRGVAGYPILSGVVFVDSK